MTEKIQEFYLVERNSSGSESCLTRNYSNGFVSGATPNTAFKFKEEEQAKQFCKMQNMLAGIFDNGTKTFYVKQDITRTKYTEDGQVVEETTEETL
ncbi:hypothetical protein C7R57_03285 [Macrococcoides caseolyticum subsp. caseolyticum]|uniref:Phage protein n=2 Tax=Staphylococcaceae TaxID=90964 RepID=A0A855GSD5_9STAP|nr:hypothetical protein [Macrococcus caseolyticus]PKE27166.1 hypothetical protein CW686_01600 [Macrococcus caseolyticus]PKE59611.1 hypothetical protein CW673_01340 [Macrococcus caseolyticus]PKE65650.1 hypothetical protein CW674_05845 [Macrococcus caseolyticus]PKE71156.1 hypothetical protein CW662_01265 [Macrococcus caseolyticus]PNZ72048.1 hypothetical protein CD152_08130 [Macrococcus caseolyticus]